MTLFIPDISHHQAGIDIQALKNQGAAALFARVGQGAGRTRGGQQYGTTRDREWARHRDEARRVGLPLVAYWYVGNLISARDNAQLAAGWVGDRSIPWMIDHEDASGNMAFYRQVVQEFGNVGLKVVLGYVPKWYYDAIGGGALTPGPPIVNSRYTTARGSASQIYAAAGGDKGNGWLHFGGQQTVMWQFTNQASFAGRAIDCSAFRGTPQELTALIGGQGVDTMQWSDTFEYQHPDGIVRKIKYGDAIINLWAERFYGSTTDPWTGPSGRALDLAAAGPREVDLSDEDVLQIVEGLKSSGATGLTADNVREALRDVLRQGTDE